MESVSQFFIEYGYIGMFVISFIAGSVFPFSSEAVMLGLLALGLDPLALVGYATVGNTLGSMFNYWIGHFGRMEWIEKYLKVKPEKLERTQRFVQGKGAIAGFFCFLPVIGSVISVALGLMRANVVITTISILAGKLVRYVVIAVGYFYGNQMM